MTRARITLARRQAAAITAAVPGLHTAMIDRGVVAPDDIEDDQDFFKILRAKTPVTMDVYKTAGDVGTPPFALPALTGSLDDSQTHADTSTDFTFIAPFYLKIDDEIILVDGAATGLVSIQRGQLATDPAAHADLSGAALVQLAKLTFDSVHSFAARERLTVSIETLLQDYAVQIICVTATSVYFANPESTASSFPGVLPSDLAYVVRLVVKAATPESFNIQEQLGDSNVDILLYFGMEYRSQTFDSIESLAMNLRAALADPSNWSSYNDGPDDLKMEEPRLMRKDNPVPGYYKFTLVFRGV